MSAEMRQAKPQTSVAADKPAPKKAAPAPKGVPKPAAGTKPTTEVGKVRQELSELRRSHALQKLDSPSKLLQTRRQLARLLTKERAKQDGK